MIDMNSEVVVTAGVVATEVDGAVTIFHPATDRYYTLTGAGAAIWHMLESTARLGDVKLSIVERYETTDEICERDVLTLVQQLEAAGWVEIGGGEP